ncbi:hypothetical protein [Limosilactobacillus vaginalis]|uniref:hypothetical protein n=1 Tax=Limosilactobacillus vaginalis TaxID=1633 RepID=UPI0025A3666C|nr:hypothetical protein [Limosilactobacillus vaginalis]MDM8259621.1 hypothetical protein [Limosilactobacillus vaginalis]
MMNNDMVTVYLYDTLDKNKLIGTTTVPRGSELIVGQTYIKPADGLYGTPMFDEGQQRWFGMSKEEWLKTDYLNGGEPTNTPSPQQQLMASLMKTNANLQKQVNMQATVNATIMKSIAELKSEAK